MSHPISGASSIQADSERLMLREVDLSLKEWGKWGMESIGMGLGFPSTAVFCKTRGLDIEECDMERIAEVEHAYTVWKMVTLASCTGAIKRHNLLLLFVLKIHYCEPGNAMDKAHHTGRMFHRAVSRATYYRLLQEARTKLAILIY